MARRSMLQNIRQSLTSAFGGVRGYQNLAAWAVAGTAAYYLWIKPELDLKREQEARLVLMREKDAHRYIERTRPRPESKDTILNYGKVKDTS